MPKILPPGVEATACDQYRFCLTAKLGKGGEADVYRGFEDGTNCVVAVKVLRRASGVLPPHEYDVLCDIPSHPHIVPRPVLTKTVRGGRPALVYPAYATDLHGIVENDGVMTEFSTRHFMVQLLQALVHLHGCGYGHNDVKLENIFVSKVETTADGPELSIVLADFGLALQGKRKTGKALGTDLFMAPEVLAAKMGIPTASKLEGYDMAAADVWSAAVCGIMALTGNGVGWNRDGIVFADCPEVKSMSPEALDFFQTAFVLSPDKRPTAVDLLKHSWLADA
jgi:serine/threonine protein kinase